MSNFFTPGSSWYPFRWFIIITAALTLCMSYTDYTGWRLLSFSGNTTRGYYGGPSGHK